MKSQYYPEADSTPPVTDLAELVHQIRNHLSALAAAIEVIRLKKIAGTEKSLGIAERQITALRELTVEVDRHRPGGSGGHRPLKS